MDAVEIARLAERLERSPALLGRLFTEAEAELPTASLAARFAAKEALIKALGGIATLSFTDIEVRRKTGNAPSFTKTTALNDLLKQRGLAWPRLSLTHDGGLAIAFVVLEQAGATREEEE